jgi:integrase
MVRIGAYRVCWISRQLRTAEVGSFAAHDRAGPGNRRGLQGHRDAQLLERDFAGSAYDDRDLVFCDELGGTIHPNRLTDWFKRRREDAGIPTGTLHILRHTAATLALTSGVPVHIVAARLGDDPKTVLSTYAHLLPSSDESPQSARQPLCALSVPRRKHFVRSQPYGLPP